MDSKTLSGENGEILENTMITFNCIKCEHGYRVSDEYAGKRVRCRECSTVNTIVAAEPKKVACGDSVAAYNNLLQELSKYEKQAPAMETDV